MISILSHVISKTAPIKKYQIKTKSQSQNKLTKDTLNNIDTLKNLKNIYKVTKNSDDLKHIITFEIQFKKKSLKEILPLIILLKIK